MGGDMIELEKYNKKTVKDKWEIPAIIPLLPLVGVNNLQPILHTSKIMVHCYTIDENINQFAIGYMINPSLKFNNVFRIKFEKCLSLSFYARTMKTIKYCLTNKNTCVMELIMIYENNGEIPKKVYRVLSCVVYSLIDNYICIEYLSCK